MARNITKLVRYPIVNGFVQRPPVLESAKTSEVPADESLIVRTGAGDVYEDDSEEL